MATVATRGFPNEDRSFTGQMRAYTPIVQKAPFTFIIDKELNRDKER